MAIAKIAPFPEYVPFAIRELMTTYDQSNYSAMEFLDEAARRIPNELEASHLVPAVAIALDLASDDDNETRTCFGTLIWFISTVGTSNAGVRDACRRILRSIGQFDLDDWHREELDEAVARVDGESF